MPTQPTRDFSFLQGCWRTDRYKEWAQAPGYVYQRLCFDEHGQGTMTAVVLDNGGSIVRTCGSHAVARYEGAKLAFANRPKICSDGHRAAGDHLDCTQGSEGLAFCSGRIAGYHYSVNLHRQP
ncbi:MAG TPA: hypothetical protein VFB45_05520 [Pseudolabrys sp.]|nr:hypothetical protein [Pseudolabrys sp.]